jgi:outer membrane biosynthesis protein TonB
MLAVAVLSMALATPQSAVRESKGRVPYSGVCESESRRRGIALVRIGNGLSMPKKVRHVQPNYPEWRRGTVGSGFWMGEFLVGTDGTVVQVWTVRAVKFTPPFPQFNQAIVNAIRQWQFEPLLLERRPVPFCATVTVQINWS